MRRRRCGDPYRGRARALCDRAQRSQSRRSRGGAKPTGRAGGRIPCTTWESEDGTCTLTLSDSTIVESGEAGVQVMYYEVLSEEPDDDGLSAQISFTRSAGEAASQTLLSINDTGGRKSISCDAFALSKSYLIAEGSEAGIELSAHSPELNELLDAEDAEIASAIAQKASSASPTATLATWDGEVYIDCNEDVLTTSFHLNDAASTIVQLSLDRGSGEMSAL